MSATAAAVSPRIAAGLRPVLLLVGVAGAVAAGVSVVLWSRGPSYSLLYANLGTEDQAQVTQALDAAGIAYRIEPGSNALEVPADRVSEARLKLAGQGLPEGDGGFSLMTKDPGLGVSQFVENARYQHALESELAHTIASLRPVDGARVHIAAARASAFVRDRHAASASVFVQLKPGRSLEQGQVQAIVNLIASSVPDLDSNQVTVVDQQGRLLSAPQGSDEFSVRERHFQLVHQLEDDYAQRIEALLSPLVGPGRVRAQVVAQVDTSVTEEAREQYKPDSQVVRSEQLSEQTSRDGSTQQGGVPGALSNQPPAAGVAQPAAGATAARAGGAPAAGGAGGAGAAAGATGGAAAGGAGAAAPAAGAQAAAAAEPESLSKQSTRNYEIDRTLDYTRQPAGRVKRLTVAVLIDDMRTVDKEGKPHERPLSSSEVTHVTELVKDAVGFDASRGDSVSVLNSSFQAETAPAETALQQVPLWEQPMVRDLAKLLAGTIVLLVLTLTVLRPLLRALLAPARAVLATPVAAEPALSAPAARAAASVAQADPGAFEQKVTQARSLVNQDAKRVAQVVRTWVSTDE